MIPYIGLLLPEVKKVLVDPIPEVRSVAARALGSLIRGMGEENFPDLVSWLLETLKSDGSNVERSGAAQGLSEILAALGKDYFEQILPDIIRNCSHQKASVRDGYLTLFKYFPRSLGVQFQNYLQQVLPAILDGLADENESVREAALSAGHVLVEHYATTIVTYGGLHLKKRESWSVWKNPYIILLVELQKFIIRFENTSKVF
ncbi:unnamed protein product [Camellia sinensis]